MTILLIFPSGCFPDKGEEYINNLKSENPVVISEAIYYLGEKEEKKAVPNLVIFLDNDQPKEIRLKALEALGKIREENSIGPLSKLLYEEDKEIRIKAVESLGKIKNPKAVIPLLKVVANKDIQLFVIWALGNIGDKSAVPVLVKLLDSPDKYIQYNAAQSLKKIGNGK